MEFSKTLTGLISGSIRDRNPRQPGSGQRDRIKAEMKIKGGHHAGTSNSENTAG